MPAQRIFPPPPPAGRSTRQSTTPTMCPGAGSPRRWALQVMRSSGYWKNEIDLCTHSTAAQASHEPLRRRHLDFVDQTAPSIESKFVSPDGKLSVTVTFFEASAVKPMFLQVRDLGLWRRAPFGIALGIGIC